MHSCAGSTRAMVDRYLPALDDFQLSEEEAAAVGKALETEKPWDWESEDQNELQALKSAKDKILAYHLARHGGNCCYCRLNLNGAGPYMTDREHILLKGKAVYKPLSYAMWNLAAACKRCNMQFKRSGNGFVVDTEDSTKFQDSDNYRFVHPNFDAYSEHLIRLEAQGLEGESPETELAAKVSWACQAIRSAAEFGLHGPLHVASLSRK